MELKPIRPFEPISTTTFPKGSNWIAQIKWDGVRILTYYDGANTRLINRRLNNRTLQYPELHQTQDYCDLNSVILDGEMIALKNGKPSFYEIMRRDGVRNTRNMSLVQRQVKVNYMIFDVLFADGEWVTSKPLEQRQQLLQSVIKPSELVQIVPNYPSAEELFKVAEQFQLEGIVIKDLSSTYAIGGKDKRWQKRKLFKDLIATVGGVTFRDGTVNALLLGLYDDQQRLLYIGHAGTGKLSQQDWRQITSITNTLEISHSPFANIPQRSKGTMWLRPALTVKVQYLEWTEAGTLRHPSIQSFVDANPKDCIFDQS
ncbi:RNA ligase family protein [Paenibacillus sediminis]|uniref:DNA ligase (ATP) n=1 Tax=Paenibacillus sediminis TaxID=664909 RepID=A0ABS4H4E1_9BACL|nr:RNA ligase family protein [Paenibacillus sediminis]MBP1937395.1 bifunctional non-homologous end joining protein LigD [Paenibacillus sediminis]